MKPLFLLFANLLFGFAALFGNPNPAFSAHPANNSGNPATASPTINYTISGYIFSDSIGGTPFEGVSVDFSGGIGAVLTDAQGYYSAEVPRGWSGIVQPSFCNDNYAFDPQYLFYTNVKKDFTDQNYVGTPAQMFTISGKFEDAQTGEPVSYEIINFDNGMQVVTNSLGYYSLEVLPCWSDTLRPESDDYTFDPEFRVYDQVSEDYNNQNYAATASSFELPPGWDYVNTGTVHIISIDTMSFPNICGVPLQEGDWIGAFYVGDDGELHCGGAGMWTEHTNTPVVVQGDDNYTPEKDGFSWGEPMNWLVYTWTTTEEEYPADPTYRTGGFLSYNNKWYPGGLSIIDEVDAHDRQSIEIPAGWSGISSSIVPGSLSITSTMEPISDELIILQTITKIYYPAAGINTIGTWNTQQGYKIKLNAPATLPVTGCPDTDKTIDLTTTWNIFPVLSACNVSTAEVFGPVENDLIVIKEVAGVNIYWPAMGINTLAVLEPGKAYMAAVTSNTSVTFPECTTAKSAIANTTTAAFKNLSPWETPVRTASTHSVAIEASATQNLLPGDFVGAFSPAGQCAGLARIDQPGNAVALTVFGDDNSTPEPEGCLAGDLISFKVYRPATGEQLEAEGTFDPSLPAANGLFIDNGLSAISQLKITTTGISGGNTENVSIYPNPANGMINISTGTEKVYLMTVSTINGQKVVEREISGQQHLDFSRLQKGIYFVKIKGENYNKIEKLILQ